MLGKGYVVERDERVTCRLPVAMDHEVGEAG